MGSSGGELVLQGQLDGLAKQTGWRKFALPTVARRRQNGLQASKGWPDRVYFRLGRIIVIETKPETGRETTAEQDTWLATWNLFALAQQPGTVIVRVVRPSEYDEIARWFS